MKICLISIIFCFISSLGYAAECPSASDWSHKKNGHWILSEKAIAEGWYVINEDIDSLYTKMPPYTPLHAFIYKYENYPSSVICLYRSRGIDLLEVENHQIPNTNISFIPPFTIDPAYHNLYYCDTNAGSSGACNWSWD